MMDTRCGIIAIAGAPNAGKSTLVNRLVGGKIAIVTPKVQTTRFNTRGVCAYKDTQFIFTDTPGLYNAQKVLEKTLVENALSGIQDADAVLFIIDGREGLSNEVKTALDTLNIKKKPVYLALNKIDKIHKPALLDLAARCDELKRFAHIFMVSAFTGDGVEDIKKILSQKMPEGPWLYPKDIMSDIPVRLLAAEVTREKLFLMLNQELPYSLAVETEKWQETETLIRISQLIYVQREGQKKIVIGKAGATLKRIGTTARKELEGLLEKKVHLELFVKVKDEHFTLIPTAY